MKREDIEKAACEESGTWAPNPIHFRDTYRRDDFEAGFYTGAEWRINSVYHKASEEPESGEIALAICEGNNPVICGPYHYDWETTVEYFNIIKWAYVKDLTPNTEDI